jgi:hypothetical protein
MIEIAKLTNMLKAEIARDNIFKSLNEKELVVYREISTKVGIGHNNPPKNKIYHIEKDTPIIPHMVADQVARESGHPSDAHVKHLVKRAHATYNANPEFRKKIQGKGDSGLNHLYTFMRHWSAAHVAKTKGQNAFERLPQGFSNGHKPK